MFLFLILNHTVASNLQIYLLECSKIRYHVVLVGIQMIGVILLIRLKRLEVLGSYVWNAVVKSRQRTKIGSN